MRCLHEGRADGALDLERLGELAAVERAVRGRLVCDAKLHALRAELAYLPDAAAALDEFEAIR